MRLVNFGRFLAFALKLRALPTVFVDVDAFRTVLLAHSGYLVGHEALAVACQVVVKPVGGRSIMELLRLDIDHTKHARVMLGPHALPRLVRFRRACWIRIARVERVPRPARVRALGRADLIRVRRERTVEQATCHSCVRFCLHFDHLVLAAFHSS